LSPLKEGDGAVGKPLWISHRGLGRAAVENTAEAFRAAVAAGFSALETDLRLTADGHVVLNHDPDFRRFAGDPRPVAALTRAEIERLRLGEQGARPLFFEEFIEEFASCSWTFDVKPESGAGVLRALDAFVRARGIKDWIIAQSKWLTWRRRDEELLSELFPGAVAYARESECWRAGLALVAHLPALGGIRAGRTYALPPRLGVFEFFRPERLSSLHRRGAKAIAFLPESEHDARAALAAGFDEILTNGLKVDG
jgi:glycerophosphoryl diester phosphodiesterase